MKSSITISLPEALKTWVDEQVAAGGFSTTSEFFRQMLREEQQQRRLRQEIDQRLHESLESGPATPMTKADWERIRREGQKRIAAKKSTAHASADR